MEQCAHTELALYCARRSYAASARHSELGVRSKCARGAPGSIGTARLHVVAARHTAAYEVVSAVLALNERLPARPGGRGEAACRGRRAGSAPQPPRAPPEQCLRP